MANSPHLDLSPIIARVEATQARLEEAFHDFSREFSSFSGNMLAQVQSLNEKVDRQNGRVTRNEQAVAGIREGLASMGAVEADGEFRSFARQREREEKAPYLIRYLKELPPRVWWSFVSLVFFITFILAVQGALPKLAESIAEHQYRLNHQREPAKPGEK